MPETDEERNRNPAREERGMEEIGKVNEYKRRDIKGGMNEAEAKVVGRSMEMSAMEIEKC